MGTKQPYDNKFQNLRIGKNSNIKENTYLFTPDYDEIIGEKQNIKDLGILLDNALKYKDQQAEAVNKAIQKSSWVLRTFQTRDVNFMRKIWNSLIQCHLDYGSILWAPVTGILNIRNMEAPLKAFTKKAKGMHDLNYWERLKNFKLFSYQRRTERYKILYIWKSLNGLLTSMGLKWINNSTRIGPQIFISNPKGPTESLKSIDKDYLRSFGAKQYNSILINLRTYTGELSVFKRGLDLFLELCPYQPRTETLCLEAKDLYRNPSNSIKDWAGMIFMNQFFFENTKEQALKEKHSQVLSIVLKNRNDK